VIGIRRAGTLGHVPLFEGLSKRELAETARVGHERSYLAGTELAREGEPGDAFYVVLEGTADVTRNGEALNELGAGDFFGEIGLLGHSARTASVVARTDVRTFVIPARSFRALIGRMPDVHGKVLAALVARAD
jgi:CRP-like cAMP-binding protein